MPDERIPCNCILADAVRNLSFSFCAAKNAIKIERDKKTMEKV